MVAAEATTVPVRFEMLPYLKAVTRITDVENYVYHEPYRKATPEYYSEQKSNALLSAQYITAVDYVRAQRVRRLVTEQFTRVAAMVDGLRCRHRSSQHTTSPIRRTTA